MARQKTMTLFSFASVGDQFWSGGGGGGGFSTNSDNEIDRRTNGVAIFLKILKKGLPHTASRPLHIHGSRGSHCIRQTMRDEA